MGTCHGFLFIAKTELVCLSPSHVLLALDIDPANHHDDF